MLGNGKRIKWIYTEQFNEAFILIEQDMDRIHKNETLFEMFKILRFIWLFERNLWMEN